MALTFFRAHLADHELIVRKYEDACTAPDGVIGYLLRDCLGLQHPPGLHAAPRRANAALAHDSVLRINWQQPSSSWLPGQRPGPSTPLHCSTLRNGCNLRTEPERRGLLCAATATHLRPVTRSGIRPRAGG